MVIISGNKLSPVTLYQNRTKVSIKNVWIKCQISTLIFNMQNQSEMVLWSSRLTISIKLTQDHAILTIENVGIKCQIPTININILED